MTFTEEIFNYITSACESQNATDDTLAEYKAMKYPRLIPMFKIETKRFYIKDYGSVMVMSTSAMGGLMKLMTISCTPYEGKDVPYLLIDCMHMLKTNLAYVEYYDCTNKNLTNTRLDNLKSRYASIPDYNETPAWYVNERMDCSMIKGGKDVNSDDLLSMVKDSIDAYFDYVSGAPIDAKNIEGLSKFQHRMITDGNPSQPTMRKILGVEGADKFFTEYVMPVL
ncbi:MAG: hypothetical protein MJ108_02265 [Saccharofermentans sp.]|nr:hypothetical protein [Saccharofermentans sp.]